MSATEASTQSPEALATLLAAVIGGLFALTAAVLAAVNALQARKWVRREQYWTRLSWACEKSVSLKPGESEMGLAVLGALIVAPWTKPEDNEMAIEVINVIVSQAMEGDVEPANANEAEG